MENAVKSEWKLKSCNVHNSCHCHQHAHARVDCFMGSICHLFMWHKLMSELFKLVILYVCGSVANSREWRWKIVKLKANSTATIVGNSIKYTMLAVLIFNNFEFENFMNWRTLSMTAWAHENPISELKYKLKCEKCVRRTILACCAWFQY